MSIYSSRDPFNDDPFPRVTVHTGARHRDHLPTLDDDTECRYDPRPEYDRPQNNPTNPILVEFRKLHEQTGNDLWTDAYLSWSDLIEEEWGTRDEYWHAFSVLGRIVSFKKEES